MWLIYRLFTSIQYEANQNWFFYKQTTHAYVPQCRLPPAYAPTRIEFTRKRCPEVRILPGSFISTRRVLNWNHFSTSKTFNDGRRVIFTENGLSWELYLARHPPTATEIFKGRKIDLEPTGPPYCKLLLCCCISSVIDSSKLDLNGYSDEYLSRKLLVSGSCNRYTLHHCADNKCQMKEKESTATTKKRTGKTAHRKVDSEWQSERSCGADRSGATHGWGAEWHSTGAIRTERKMITCSADQSVHQCHQPHCMSHPPLVMHAIAKYVKFISFCKLCPTSITANVLDSLWDFSTTFWRRRELRFQFWLQIFRRRVGIFSLFFLCGFYFLLKVHVNFSSVFYRDYRAVVTSSRHRPFWFHNFVFLLNCLFVMHRPIRNRSALGGNTLLLFSGICTGCLSDAVSSSSWRPTFMLKALNGLAPAYLTDDCHLVRCQLFRSSVEISRQRYMLRPKN